MDIGIAIRYSRCHISHILCRSILAKMLQDRAVICWLLRIDTEPNERNFEELLTRNVAMHSSNNSFATNISQMPTQGKARKDQANERRKKGRFSILFFLFYFVSLILFMTFPSILRRFKGSVERRKHTHTHKGRVRSHTVRTRRIAGRLTVCGYMAMVE